MADSILLALSYDFGTGKYEKFLYYFVDESLSKKVMCLLAELYLCTSQPERTVAIINNLEKVLFSKREGSDGSTPAASPAETMTESQAETWKLNIALVCGFMIFII